MCVYDDVRFTTILAVVVLAFSQSEIFRTLFKLTGLIVGYALIVGVAFMPAVLSVVGPASLRTEIIAHQNKLDAPEATLQEIKPDGDDKQDDDDVVKQDGDGVQTAV